MSMSNTVIQAMKRRRKKPGWKGMLFPYPKSAEDNVILADAFLDEHREDDGEPITVEWLEKQPGWYWENQFCNSDETKQLSLRNSSLHFVELFRTLSHEKPDEVTYGLRLGTRGELGMITTRGDLRTLRRALKA